MIKTARYSNKKIKNYSEYYPVGISLGTPKFPLGYNIREQCYVLAPRKEMLKMEFEPYKKLYFKKLNDFGKDRLIGILREMEKRAEEEKQMLVLLCFEDIRIPSDWCHRRLFAEWWKENTGEEIEELEEETPLKQTKAKKVETPSEEIDQTSLF